MGAGASLVIRDAEEAAVYDSIKSRYDTVAGSETELLREYEAAVAARDRGEAVGAWVEGKALAKGLKATLADRVSSMARKPRLSVLMARRDEASDAAALAYIGRQRRSCESVGIEMTLVELPPDEEAAVAAAQAVDADDAVDAILVLSPLPVGWDGERVTNCVSRRKDVDGLNRENRAALATAAATGAAPTAAACFAPCTAEAVLAFLAHLAGGSLRGADVCVVGSSAVVGLPVCHLLLSHGATPTVCHIHTTNLAEKLRRADFVVSAAGKAGLIDKTMVKPGAVVIDVGMNSVERDGDTVLVGDVDRDVASVARLTAVPGGVGPVTAAVLLSHVVEAAEARAPDAPAPPPS